MAIRLIGVNSNNNGRNGIVIDGRLDVHIDGITTNGNAANGILIIHKDSVFEELGLPADTDAAAVRRVLVEIIGAKAGATPEEIVRRSGIFKTIQSAGLDLSTFMANVSTLCASPHIQAIIASLHV